MHVLVDTSIYVDCFSHQGISTYVLWFKLTHYASYIHTACTAVIPTVINLTVWQISGPERHVWLAHRTSQHTCTCIKGVTDLLSSGSSQVASCNALDIIIMGKVAILWIKTMQAKGLASYCLYFGLTVRRLSSQESGSKPDAPKYHFRSGASEHCDNTSLMQIRAMNSDSVIICKIKNSVGGSNGVLIC